jgi:transcription elongation factor S-II
VTASVKVFRKCADAECAELASRLMAQWRPIAEAHAKAEAAHAKPHQAPPHPHPPAAASDDKEREKEKGDDGDKPPASAFRPVVVAPKSVTTATISSSSPRPASPGLGSPGSVTFGDHAPPEDPQRRAIYDRFAEYLACVDTQADLSSEFLAEPVAVASRLERHLFKLFKGTGKDYQAKFRMLASCLKSNAELRLSLLREDMTPEQLCAKRPQELANDDLKKAIEKARKDALDLAAQNVLAKEKMTGSTVYKCSKCGKRDTSFYQLQTRSADEPMTTFITCNNCGHKWKYC